MPYQCWHRSVAQNATPCVATALRAVSTRQNLQLGRTRVARLLGLREFSSGWPPLGFHGTAIFRRDRSLALDQGRIRTASRLAVGDQPPNCETRARTTNADLRPLLARVEGMMREFARVKSHVAALQNLQAGTVDIYCFQAAIESFVLPTLQQFHMRYPNVFFNVTVSSADKTIEALTNGSAEIGLVLNPPVRDSIARTEIFRDKIVAAVAPTHPLAGR